MLGTVQGLLMGEPSSHLPDGKTEALSGQVHSPRSYSREGADANPGMPDSRHPSAAQCMPGLQIIEHHSGSTWGPHLDLQMLGFGNVLSGPKPGLRRAMRYSCC